MLVSVSTGIFIGICVAEIETYMESEAGNNEHLAASSGRNNNVVVNSRRYDHEGMWKYTLCKRQIVNKKYINELEKMMQPKCIIDY